jgi:putative FmdB family regulatory protein
VAVYEYRCRSCDEVFEVRRPMSEADAPAVCPSGHDDAVRLLSVFAGVSAGAATGSSVSNAPTGPCGGGCACFPG